jgi:hypothetical protein
MSVVCRQEECHYWTGSGCACALLDLDGAMPFCPFSLTGICPSNPQCEPGRDRLCLGDDDD